MKNILVYNLFYHIILDMTSPLLESMEGNKYVLVAIDHYSSIPNGGKLV
jgi:hypothetical protein